MPPFLPRKRSPSPAPVPAKRPSRQPTPQQTIETLDSSDSSSLSSISTSNTEDPPNELKLDDARNDKSSDGDSDDTAECGSRDEDGIDWEDAMDKAPVLFTPTEDLELTLDKTATPVSDLLEGKKGPSRIERSIRTNTHRMHVQCLLFHNALRNFWVNDAELHRILLCQLPAGIQKEVQKWRVASGLESPEMLPESTRAQKVRGKSRSNRAWSDGASRLEPDQPDMSRGDPTLSLLRVLATYWKKQFTITAPGLRKRGYRPISMLEEEVSSFQRGEQDSTRHGERICDRNEFRALAARRQGSRDVGAQLFTALLRALGIETRLVANLQLLGFGWTKAEVCQSSETITGTVLSEGSHDETGTEKNQPGYDSDLPFPIYWSEVASPITHEIIPVDPLVLPNPVATTPELMAAFEPRGARADKAKQVIAYVIAHSADGTAKDVTTRYLRRRMWPGKTKGFRLAVEKIPLPDSPGRTRFYEHDWFRVTMRGYVRPQGQRTATDDIEDGRDLISNQPERKSLAREGDTLQSLRVSTEFVLERFLRRDEAIRPGAQHARTYVSGRGDKVREEPVFRRADVVKCLSAESWHKEGRRVRAGEQPLKLVPIRVVTLLRKRAVDELERRTGEKPQQGLYTYHQTEVIIPPPIEDGMIPKNEYGNIDCFVPTMVPTGAVHIPWSGTARVCRRMGVDFAEAVTGFEFGSKMAVPVIEGVVVAEENADLVRDAWRADQEARLRREQQRHEQRILVTWRRFLMGLRIVERVRAEHGDNGDSEALNPFAVRPAAPARLRVPAEEEDQGGGFLLVGHDDDGDLMVTGPAHEPVPARNDHHDEVDLVTESEGEDSPSRSKTRTGNNT